MKQRGPFVKDSDPRRQHRSGRRLLVAWVFLAGLVVSSPLLGQSGNFFNQRDDTYRLLGLKRAKAAYDKAKADHQRVRRLFEQHLIPRAEVDRSASGLTDAEVNYHQSLLAVLFEGQYVAIIKAIKYQSPEGKKHVRLTLENTSGGGDEYKRLLNIDDALFRSLQPEVVHDVYVSLLDEGEAIISSPYEFKIEELRYGQPAEIDFILLRDAEEVTVGLSYGNGSRRSPRISLEKDEGQDKVILQSEQFSQEAELGGIATFDLTLELFSGRYDTFKLEAVNLPREINRFFLDPSSQARLSQFKFNEGNNVRKANLQVSLPDRPGVSIRIDEPIPFFVLVIPRDQSLELGDASARIWSQKEIEDLGVGYQRLELLPRGMGELVVRAPQLYFSSPAGHTIEIALDLRNEGTQRLDNVELRVDPPLNWAKSVDPPLLKVLEVGDEKRFKVMVQPPDGVPVGKYEVRIQSTSFSETQPVDGEDKSVTIEIPAEVNLAGVAAVTAAIVGLVLGIVIFGIRLSRK